MSHNTAEPKVEITTTADDEEGRATNLDEASPVKAEASAEYTAAPPGGLLSPYATDKPLPTANGPTSRVVTRPRLSRTLDLSTNVCVEPATAAAQIKAAAELGRLTPPTDVRPDVTTTTTTTSNTDTGNVRPLLRFYQYVTLCYDMIAR